MIRLEDVSAGYGKKKVISLVNADIARGRLTVVIGPNGCGKSTLLKSISGMIPLMSGEISVDGAHLKELKRAEVAKRIAYLPQGRNVPDMTLYQLVLNGRFPHLSYPRRYSEADKRIAREAMDRMGILQLENEPVKELSGGLRQSAYIAMALCQESDCILFDEPSTHLDISHTLSLMNQMRELAHDGRAIAAVMHDIPMALDFADEVIVMKDGKALLQGSPDEICLSGVMETVFGIGVEKSGTRYGYGNNYKNTL